MNCLNAEWMRDGPPLNWHKLSISNTTSTGGEDDKPKKKTPSTFVCCSCKSICWPCVPVSLCPMLYAPCAQINSAPCSTAVELRKYIFNRLLSAHRAYRLFPCMESTSIGFKWRTNNWSESYHRSLKYNVLRCVACQCQACVPVSVLATNC